MPKARFREEAINNGDKIELPECTALTIHVDPNRKMATVITWLEEVKE